MIIIIQIIDIQRKKKKKKEHNLYYTKHIRSPKLPGKPGYRAPEIETRIPCDPKLADAFSFGFIAWNSLALLYVVHIYIYRYYFVCKFVYILLSAMWKSAI